MDNVLPRAGDSPAAASSLVPTATNPLGVGHVGMPATPERIRCAVRDARRTA